MVHSVEEAHRTAGKGEIAVIGGAAIYDVFMAHADPRSKLTEIHADFDGDTFMKTAGPRMADHGARRFCRKKAIARLFLRHLSARTGS